jgi:hypothetical protein
MYLTALKLREYLLTRLAVTFTQISFLFFLPFLVLTSFYLLFVGKEALYHTQTHTLDRTPLDEGSARPRGLYLRAHNTQNRHPCPRRNSNSQSNPASERPQTHALDRAATGISSNKVTNRLLEELHPLHSWINKEKINSCLEAEML